MHTLTLPLAGLTLVAGVLAPAPAPQPGPSQTHEESAPAAPENPHARAPINVSLFITEDALLRAPQEEWFEAQAELNPDRFEYVEELVDIDGDFEPGFRDKTGEFLLRYDAEEDELVYWQHVSAELLTRGRQDFVQFCSSCHGLDGDGYGRSAQHLRPPPRDFRQSNFKFTKVPGDELPSDAALMKLVKRGLNGTPMLPWALSDEQLGEIIQYVKSLSPEGEGWRDVYAVVGDMVDPGEDPWTGDAPGAVTFGEQIYHGKARCHSCHPGYLAEARLNEVTGAAAGTAARADLTYPVPKVSTSYEVLGHSMLLVPPDFTWHDVRSGIELVDLVQTIGSGIGGTAMPKWKGQLSDKEIWAMAYYVRDLIQNYKGKPAERSAFMADLRGS
jgi:mono/diheme cytochrome c family protein